MGKEPDWIFIAELAVVFAAFAVAAVVLIIGG